MGRSPRCLWEFLSHLVGEGLLGGPSNWCHLQGEQPQLQDLLTMVLNRLLNGMILQVGYVLGRWIVNLSTFGTRISSPTNTTTWTNYPIAWHQAQFINGSLGSSCWWLAILRISRRLSNPLLNQGLLVQTQIFPLLFGLKIRCSIPTNHYPTNPFSNKPIQYPLRLVDLKPWPNSGSFWNRNTRLFVHLSGQEVEGRSQHQWSESPTKIPRNPWTYGSLMSNDPLSGPSEKVLGGRSSSTHIFRFRYIIYIYIFIIYIYIRIHISFNIYIYI